MDPHGSTGSSATGGRLRSASGAPAHAHRRTRGPMQEALAQDHRGRPRSRGGQGPDPAPLRAVRGDRPPLRRRHHLHRHLGGLGLPGHGHRPGLPEGRRLGAGRPHAHRARRRRTEMAFANRRPRQASSSTRTGAVNTRARTSASSPGPTASCCRSDGRASAGTTPWPRASLPPSSASSSTRGPGRRGQDSTVPSSSTSRAGTTPAGCTRLGYLSPAQYEVLHHNADRQAA